MKYKYKYLFIILILSFILVVHAVSAEPIGGWTTVASAGGSYARDYSAIELATYNDHDGEDKDSIFAITYQRGYLLKYNGTTMSSYPGGGGFTGYKWKWMRDSPIDLKMPYSYPAGHMVTYTEDGGTPAIYTTFFDTCRLKDCRINGGVLLYNFSQCAYGNTCPGFSPNKYKWWTVSYFESGGRSHLVPPHYVTELWESSDLSAFDFYNNGSQRLYFVARGYLNQPPPYTIQEGNVNIFEYTKSSKITSLFNCSLQPCAIGIIDQYSRMVNYTDNDGSGNETLYISAVNGALWKYNRTLNNLTQETAAPSDRIGEMVVYNDGTEAESAIFGASWNTNLSITHGYLFKYNTSLGSWSKVADQLNNIKTINGLLVFNDSSGDAIFATSYPDGSLLKYNASLGGWLQLAKLGGLGTDATGPLVVYDVGDGRGKAIYSTEVFWNYGLSYETTYNLLRYEPLQSLDFTANITTGFIPLTVNFNETVVGLTPTEWTWDFNGDGIVDATSRNATKTYNTPGIYTVNHSASDGFIKRWENKTNYITALDPSVDFTGTPDAGYAPLTVTFSSLPVGFSPTSWTWDFNRDGIVDSTSENPLYSYSTSGFYTVNHSATEGAVTRWQNKTDYIHILSYSDPEWAATGGLSLVHDVNGSTIDLYGYQVKFTVYNQSPFAYSYADKNIIHINSTLAYLNFSDLRFVNESGIVMPYWINTSVDRSSWSNHTDLWVRFPFIKKGLTTKTPFTIFWNNTTLQDMSDGYATFVMFDHFNGTALNTTEYSSIPDYHRYNISNSILDLFGFGGFLLTARSFPVNASLVMYVGLAPPSGGSTYISYYNDDGTTADWYTDDSEMDIFSYDAYDFYVSVIDQSFAYTRNIYEVTQSSRGAIVTINDSMIHAVILQYPSPSRLLIDNDYRNITIDAIFIHKWVCPEPSFEPPVPIHVDFTANTTSATTIAHVQFTDTSTDVPPLSIYYWDFGDGYTSTERDPIHYYTSGGLYTVKHSVSDCARTFWNNKTDFILVYDEPHVDLSVNNTLYPENVGAIWHLATDNAAFGNLVDSGVTVHDGKLWIIGGYDTMLSSYTGNIWNSTDGIIWNLASAGTFSRAGMATISFDGQLWVVGGYDGSSVYSDIYSSPDGIAWTYVNDTPFVNRYARLMILNNKMYLVSHGGTDSWYDDVWVTEDENIWTEVTPSGGFGTVLFGDAILDNKMWIVGGADINDVVGNAFNTTYYSTDGLTWAQATPNAEWTARGGQGSTTFDAKMWVVGGARPDPPSGCSLGLNDTWHSSDGVTWSRINETPAFTARSLTSAVVLNRNTMYLVGGYYCPTTYGMKDVWYTTRNTTHYAYTHTEFEFRDDSRGQNITERYWDFGNGDFSTSKHTTYTYLTPGTYFVNHSATSSPGTPWNATAWYNETTIVITASPVPVPDFSALPLSGIVPLTVSFTDLTAGYVIGYNWSFGDGTYSQLQNPSHTYTQAGFYTVRMNVSSWEWPDQWMNKTGYILVTNPVQLVNFSSAPNPNIPGSNVQFTDLTVGTNITYWSWSFGDVGTSNLQNPVHQYAATGWYDISLTAYDSYGTPWEVSATNTSLHFQHIVNATPSANFVANLTTIYNNACVKFTDLTSGLGLNSWIWNFGDGSEISDGPSIVHCYSVIDVTIPYHFTVSLNASNDGGYDIETKVNYIYMPSSYEALPPTFAPTTGPTPAGTPEPPVGMQHPIGFDFANGTYLHYWINGSVTELPVYGFIWSLILPLWNFFGWWLFAIFWFVFVMGIYLNTQEVGLPLIAGAIAGTVMAVFFPWEAKIIAGLVLALCFAGLLIRAYYEQ